MREKKNQWGQKSMGSASHYFSACIDSGKQFEADPSDSPLIQLTNNVDTQNKFTEKKMRIGKNIAERRKQLALTQMRLAERVGVDAETITRFEAGADWPTLQMFEKLAAALNLELYDLLRKLPPFPKSKGRERDVIRGTRKTVHDKSISGTLLTGNKAGKSLKP